MGDEPRLVRTLLGFGSHVVVYHCPNCATKLRSPVNEAGTSDICPKCSVRFLVPGESERRLLENRKAITQTARAWVKKRGADTAQKVSEPTGTDTSDVVPLKDTTENTANGESSRARFLLVFAALASVVLMIVAAVAFDAGRESTARQQTARPQLNVSDDSIWQSRTSSSSGAHAEEASTKTSLGVHESRGADASTIGKESSERKREDTRDKIAAAEMSVVTLEVPLRSEPATKTGSGFILRPGAVVTNYHVVEDSEMVLVKFKDRRQIYSDGYLAIDERNDLALIKCETGSIEPLPLGAMPAKLDSVYAIGAPEGFSGTISNGIVSGLLERKLTGTKIVQTTAPISHGSSGGPLLNDKGEVVGVTTSVYRGAQNVNFAVAAAHIEELSASSSNIPHQWKELPESAASKRRTELRRLANRIEEVKRDARVAYQKSLDTFKLADQADIEAKELAREMQAFLDGMERARLAGNRELFEQYAGELDSGKWSADKLNALRTKRDQLAAKSKEQSGRGDLLKKQLDELRMQYATLVAKETED